MSYLSWKGGVAAAALLASLGAAGPASALPIGWTGVGGFGTLGPDGVVTAPPAFGPNYSYITTLGGQVGVGALAGYDSQATNGSTLTTNVFSANAGSQLSFYFNYVSSDGSQYTEYAWARLLDGIGNEVAILFTARTTPSGDTVPGFGLPGLAPGVTLTPPTTPIQAGTTWSPLGGYSGQCFGPGCGHSGWIDMEYTIQNAGNYQLQFGVTNWIDQIWDSGMAIAGATIDDQPIGVPEPMSLALFGLGLAGLGAATRRRKAA